MSWKDHLLTTEASLREVIPAPGISAHKVLDHIDEHCRRFLDHASFALIATWDAQGRADVSPGRGSVTRDPELLDTMTVGTKRPKLALVIEVDEAFVHCGKAARRGGLWSGGATSRPPSA